MADERRFRRLFRLPQRRERIVREVDDELHFHLDMRIDELRRNGLSADAARAEALRQFGDVEEARRYCRDMDALHASESRRAEWWGDASRDVRLAVRALGRQPAFTAAIVVMLALGIGANVTMLGIVDRLLLRPPAHVAEPELVRRLYFSSIEDGGVETEPHSSYPLYLAVAEHMKSARSVGAFWTAELAVGQGEASRRAKVTLASASLFPTLGVRPALGRFFTTEEDVPPRGMSVAVISHALWQGEYGGSAAVLDRDIVIVGRRFRVIGVAPRGFSGVDLERVDVWVPVSALAGELLDGRYSKEPWYEARSVGWLRQVVRIGDGDEARRRAEHEATAGLRASLVAGKGEAKADSMRPRAALEPLILERGPDRSATSNIAVWLAGMSLVVLLIACANVANLLLARALTRRREVAVRIALGAGRGRLVRQLLVEGVVLAAMGGGGAVLVAHWGGGFLRAVLMPDVAWESALGEPRLLLAAAAVALLTGIGTGLVPALQVSNPDLAGALKSGAREGGGERLRTRRALVVAQAALSVLLLVGAGLFLQSLHNVRSMELGYAPEQVLTVDVDLTGTRYSAKEETELHDRFLERVAAVPGVRSAALSITTPFSTTIDVGIALPGRDSLRLPASAAPLVNAVTPGYFETMQTPIVRGRGITEADRFGAPPVAVVNELMARTLWPGGDAIGECVMLVEQPGKPCVEVVGVARGVVWSDFREEPRMQLYVAMAQKVYDFSLRALYVRGGGDPAALAKAVRAAVLEVEPGARFVNVRPLAVHQEAQLRPWRMGATLFTIFGALALVLAALGLYSVIAYNVTRRMREMGVRVALGARGRDILRLVVIEGVRVAAVGVALGAAATLLAGRWIEGLLFRTSPSDPLILGSVVAILLGVAVMASLVPAVRATGVAPGVALREE